MIDDSADPIGRTADEGPAPSRRIAEAERAARAALRAPRVLARCTTAAAAGAVTLVVAAILAATALRSSPLAFHVMLASTLTIVGAMTLATLVSMRAPAPAERPSFPAGFP
jgi:hypothetical protein